MCNKTSRLIVLGILGLFFQSASIYAEEELRDPTQPSSYSDTVVTSMPSSDIVITATFISKDHKSVMIGNHNFTLGEKVSGLLITGIDANGITVKNDDGSERKIIMPIPTIKLLTNTNKKEEAKP